jgi:hypothetical protein
MYAYTHIYNIYIDIYTLKIHPPPPPHTHIYQCHVPTTGNPPNVPRLLDSLTLLHPSLWQLKVCLQSQ